MSASGVLFQMEQELAIAGGAGDRRGGHAVAVKAAGGGLLGDPGHDGVVHRRIA